MSILTVLGFIFFGLLILGLILIIMEAAKNGRK
jgi:hypothetical protein